MLSLYILPLGSFPTNVSGSTVDGQVQVTTTRVKGGRKAVIPSSIDPVGQLEDIGKETVKKLLNFQSTVDSVFKKLQEKQEKAQGAAGSTVRDKHGHLTDHIKPVSTGVSSALQHLTNCSVSINFFELSADHCRSATRLLVQLFNIRAGTLQSPLQLWPGHLHLSQHVYYY